MIRAMRILFVLLSLRTAIGPRQGRTTFYPAMRRLSFVLLTLMATHSNAACPPLLDVALPTLSDDKPASICQYQGKVILAVNTASQCGYTPQYAGLEKLWKKYRDKGLVVLGFPANDFGAQEPGTDAEIAEFCSSEYSVTFPVMSKISVVGDDQHELYATLTEQAPTADGKAEMRERLRGHGLTPTDDPDVLWNFEKFLIGKEGTVVARFAPPVAPDDPALVGAIEAELSK
jgi:glutathione peroxidase